MTARAHISLWRRISILNKTEMNRCFSSQTTSLFKCKKFNSCLDASHTNGEKNRQ